MLLCFVFCFFQEKNVIYLFWLVWLRPKRWRSPKMTRKRNKWKAEKQAVRGQTRPVLHRARWKAKENRAILVDFYDHAAVAPTNEYVSFRLAHGRRPGIAWCVFVFLWVRNVCRARSLFTVCEPFRIRLCSIPGTNLVHHSSSSSPLRYRISRSGHFSKATPTLDSGRTSELDFSWFSG